MIDLYVNNTRIPLAGSERIQLKRAVGKIGSIQSRIGSFSNDFEVPASAEISDVLGYANNFDVRSTFPYTKQAAKLLSNGQELSRGFVQVRSYNSTKKTFTLTYYSGIKSFTNDLGTGSIRDIDYSDLDHTWDTTDIIASFGNTTGYIYPWINYRRLNLLVGDTTEPMIVTDWYPAIFQHVIIERMVRDAGWKLGGSFLDSWAYKNTLIPFALESFVSPQGVDYVPGNTITLGQTLPPFSKIDFLRDMIIRHGILPTVEEATQTLYLDSWQYILSRTGDAVDWSNKVDLSEAINSIFDSGVISDYAEKNWFEYQEPNDFETVGNFLLAWARITGTAFGSDSIDIDNEWLNAENDFFTSIFYPTYNAVAFTDPTNLEPWITIPLIERYDPTGAASYDPGYRILYLAGEFTISDVGYYNSTNKYYIENAAGTPVDMGTTCAMAYFCKQKYYGKLDGGAITASDALNAIAENLSFNDPNFNANFPAVWPDADTGEGLLTTWFSRLNRILNQPRTITLSVKLWTYEFFQVDFRTPIFIHAGNVKGYFYLNEITYDSDGKTQAELIQII